MILAADLHGYEMAIPFRFGGVLFPSGSWICLYGSGVRLAFPPEKMALLFPGLTVAR